MRATRHGKEQRSATRGALTTRVGRGFILCWAACSLICTYAPQHNIGAKQADRRRGARHKAQLRDLGTPSKPCLRLAPCCAISLYVKRLSFTPPPTAKAIGLNARAALPDQASKGFVM